MRIVGCVAKCKKTTLRRIAPRSVVLTLLGMAAGYLTGNACAQGVSGVFERQTSSAVSMDTTLSGNETILAPRAQRLDVQPGKLGNPKDRLVQPHHAARGNASVRVATSNVNKPVNVEKVNATAIDTPASSVVRGVTLWDELAPPSSMPGRADTRTLSPAAGVSTSRNR